VSRPRLIEILGFAFVGAIVAALFRGTQADVGVQLGLAASLVAMLVVGHVVEELLGLGASLRHPFHRLALGQLGLLVWFYLRSAIGVGGVTSLELWGLVLAGLGFLWYRSRRVARRDHGELWAAAGIAIAWWVAAFTFVSMRSGALAPPASDPDLHSYMAKLIAQHGHVVYDHLPYDESPLVYPSAFAALNALTTILSGAEPVAVVGCQTALQVSLAVGLLVETVVALRGGRAFLLGAIVLVMGHYLVMLPTSAAHPLLEGIPRLADKAMLILPLTFLFRLADSELGRWRRVWSVLAVSAFAGTWAVVMNPSLAIPQLPILVVVAMLLPWFAAPSLRDRPLGAGNLLLALVVLATPALLLGNDAWVRFQVARAIDPPPPPPAAIAAEPASPAPPPPPVRPGAVWRAGVRRAMAGSAARVIAPVCQVDADCPWAIGSLRRGLPIGLTLLALAWLGYVGLRPRRRDPRITRVAAAALGLVAAGWLVQLSLGLVLAWLAQRPPTGYADLLREYGEGTSRQAQGLLFLVMVAVSLAFAGRLLERWRRGWFVDAAVALLALGVVTLEARRHPASATAVLETYRLNELNASGTNLGPIERADIAFVRRVAELVPRGERVLLLGYTWRKNRDEHWNFAFGPSRALPLYADVGFAFFHGQGTYTAADYEARVCETFDLPWLAARGITWLFYSDSAFDRTARKCPRSWLAIRDHYFVERLRSGDRALYQLRADRLDEAARDHRLGL
jgi:hypothetical protein